jgi:hypothetical protein
VTLGPFLVHVGKQKEEIKLMIFDAVPVYFFIVGISL